MSIIYLFVVLKAISEDSPTVPTLLTDYILKGMPKFNFISFMYENLNNFFIQK